MRRVLTGEALTPGARTRRFLIGCLVIGFLSLIAALGAAIWVNGRSRDHSYWLTHTYQVEQAITNYRVLIEQSEAARRGYLLAGAPVYRTNFDRITLEMPPALATLAHLVHDNRSQVDRVVRLRTLTEELTRYRTQANALRAAGRTDAARRAFLADGSAATLDALRATGEAMTHEERGLLAQRDAEQRASVRTFLLILGIAALLLVVVAITTLVTMLRYTRDLGTTGERLRELNDSLEDAVAERTADLTRANEEIQRFAYIVSHDLRSPLVNVMGFTAELDSAAHAVRELIDRAEENAPGIVTEEARQAAREDLPEAIGFIRSSTQKMDALINAILKLSREGRRVLTPEPIDMEALVDQIGGTIQHRLDERDAELAIHRPLPGIVSDRLAVDQIFSNLIENAAKYLRPDRPGLIEVRGRVENNRAIFEVADNGRGIDPKDHARVFDLFRRSGTQDQPGEGIGLAHVRALVQRLGGSIDVSSELGTGATFRVSLPLSLISAQDDRK